MELFQPCYPAIQLIVLTVAHAEGVEEHLPEEPRCAFGLLHADPGLRLAVAGLHPTGNILLHQHVLLEGGEAPGDLRSFNAGLVASQQNAPLHLHRPVRPRFISIPFVFKQRIELPGRLLPILSNRIH